MSPLFAQAFQSVSKLTHSNAARPTVIEHPLCFFPLYTLVSNSRVLKRDGPKLLIQHESRERRLHNVGTVQTVNAIDTESTLLLCK